jgi:phospholipase/carboxylesterase
MPQTNYWRTDRPDEGGHTAPIPTGGLPIRTVLPDQYEPRYPYPLLVVFHGRGQNEDLVLRLAPRLSAQNFVYISLRGPEVLPARPDGRPAFGWAHGDPDALFGEYVRLSVELTRRTYHVHSERVYLLGVNEGVEAAFRAGFALAGRIGGVIALNGLMPRVTDRKPLFRMQDVRGMRVFLGRGAANPAVTAAAARRDYNLLYAAGADVRAGAYPTNHRLHSEMLRDVNRWVIGNVNAEHDQFACR